MNRFSSSPRFTGIAWLCGLSGAAVVIASAPAFARHGELPNKIPEPAPYNTEEAKTHPPPYDKLFSGTGNPHVCETCHKRIFDEWNGSMMSNSWRDPAWRAAFLLIARLVSTDGNCDLPNPPDGSKKNHINPFGNEDCTSTFNLGGEKYTTTGSGSLLDDFCSRCHMPANYIDNYPLKNVVKDKPSGVEHGMANSDFDPTSDNGTGIAYATVEEKFRNTEAGKLGLTCTFCHTMGETRVTPFHNYEKVGADFTPAPPKGPREGLKPNVQEMGIPDPKLPNLGFGVGGGAYRLSPEALSQPERFGPLSHFDHSKEKNGYLSEVFKSDYKQQLGDFKGSIHKGNYHAMFERAEMCATCHDVTNPLTVMNKVGRWVGGFPIERTYSEWSKSRYADRPGNANFDPKFKRDCETCHMQQDYGVSGTAQTLYKDGHPLPVLVDKVATTGPERPYFSHHFIGGNSYSTRLVGADVDSQGKTAPYPELSSFSYSSEDENSPFHNAYWQNISDKGPQTQHARMAWDRVRSAVEVELSTVEHAPSGTNVKLGLKVVNSGTGHNFPTGFPEGRNAWVAVRAFDVATGRELEIEDSFWKRRSLGVGYFTDHEMVDPNFPNCEWMVPAGAPDPYAYQFRAVASLGNGCPTLDLPYATPLNLQVNKAGFPVDASGQVIDRANPLGLPLFKDVDGDGDVFDDAFLIDNRLRPMPNAGATLNLDRYSVVIPKGIVGPVAVTGAIYYQSMEAVVAKKFLGNMADTDLDHKLEPCVMKGLCDGRVPHTEPAVVEGSPPVPVRVQSAIVNIEGQDDITPPEVSVYPSPNQQNVYRDVVVKVTASEPLAGMDEKVLSLVDADGNVVPAKVAQISDYTWAVFPNKIFLERGKAYTVHLAPVCDLNYQCTKESMTWSFTIAQFSDNETGDTRPPAPPIVHPRTVVRPQNPIGDGIATLTAHWRVTLALLVAIGGGLALIGAGVAQKLRRA